jgi:hypothetical protein
MRPISHRFLVEPKAWVLPATGDSFREGMAALRAYVAALAAGQAECPVSRFVGRTAPAERAAGAVLGLAGVALEVEMESAPIPPGAKTTTKRATVMAMAGAEGRERRGVCEAVDGDEEIAVLVRGQVCDAEAAVAEHAAPGGSGGGRAAGRATRCPGPRASRRRRRVARGRR